MKFKKQFIAGGTILSVFVIGALFIQFQSKSAREVRVVCQSTQGPLEIRLHPDWSPNGVRRFLEMVRDGFFEDLPLFRCVDNFICQFGARPPGLKKMNYSPIPDDSAKGNLLPFRRGYLSFAGSGTHSRNTHLFITLGKDLSQLGQQPWETPIGFVSETSMNSTVLRWNKTYGEMAPWGKGPDPAQIESENGGNYLQRNFPNLDYLQSCAIAP